jgi:hypothetical protein
VTRPEIASKQRRTPLGRLRRPVASSARQFTSRLRSANCAWLKAHAIGMLGFVTSSGALIDSTPALAGDVQLRQDEALVCRRNQKLQTYAPIRRQAPPMVRAGASSANLPIKIRPDAAIPRANGR